ncbi:FtsK/SpoIIIE family DNA translocase [Paucilactobacillus wasatchensis]|uniref:DNA translocase FtsK n=1 Tax=Paucilactobacillus wasatchensis TaxID=1335616 RepID=A0A0D1A7Q8_9LACO|nr:DNA translocase FtsK [Paucilactobacillus wasatchensis]KIS02776.1 Cell division protein FtsK [Paucilactobacillus wasatchensis]
MAAKKTRRKRKTTKRKTSNSSKYDSALNNLLGVVILLLILLGLFNLGAIGTLVVNLFRVLVGQTYPLALVIIGIYALGLTFKGQWPHFKFRFLLGGLLAYIGVLLLFHGAMFNQLDRHADFVTITWTNLNQDIVQGSIDMPVGGGMIGAYLYQLCYFLVSNLGTTLVAILLIIIGVVVFFKLPVAKILNTITVTASKGARSIKSLQNKHELRAHKKHANEIKKEKPVAEKQQPAESQRPVTDFFSDSSVESDASQTPNITVASDSEVKAANKPDVKEDDIKLQPAQESENADYQLPATTLLTKVQATDQSKELNAIKLNTKTLQDTLASFGVDAKVENVNLGPSVTKYELRPAVGVKVSRIVHLADDLALALAAKDIRIEAPIPGKSLIGIEVPNRQIATVGFRDMVEAAPTNNKMLEVPLGRAVTGQVMTADLTKMPHLLIAGATGSGKSVAINVIITSILLKAKPHQVKFLMIDPKKVELSVYNGIPHLLSPVVSEPKRAAKALGKVVSEMERRYELFAGFGVRNIAGYNKMVRESNEQDQDNKPYLPLISVIVDELADLMMTVSNDVEDAIVRIAQMGRAAGIHMILATQRPSVDVITGLIKANVPSRIAFAVSSGIDSRTILDSNGAEKLLGRGDMLFMPIDQNKPVRIQGAFISDHDVEAVVDFIKKEQPAQYDDSMVVKDDEIKADEANEDEDELFGEALDFVVDQQKASTSLIQRRFRIGYNRAARMIDEMEQRGLIGPSEGSKPRQVYKQKEEQ